MGTNFRAEIWRDMRIFLLYFLNINFILILDTSFFREDECFEKGPLFGKVLSSFRGRACFFVIIVKIELNIIYWKYWKNRSVGWKKQSIITPWSKIWGRGSMVMFIEQLTWKQGKKWPSKLFQLKNSMKYPSFRNSRSIRFVFWVKSMKNAHT